MKKSELRKIIKESLKHLISEQPWPLAPVGCVGFGAAQLAPPHIGCCGKCWATPLVGSQVVSMNSLHSCYNFCMQWASCCKCDTSPTSDCAQTWFGPIATNMTNFMANKICGPAGPGISTFQGAYDNNYDTFTNFTNTYPPNNPQSLQSIENSTNWSDINNTINSYALAVNQTSGIAMPGMEKGQMKRAYAKSQWAECMIGKCGCQKK